MAADPLVTDNENQTEEKIYSKKYMVEEKHLKNDIDEPDFSAKSPREQYSNLSLSGRIITATFVVPYSIKLNEQDEWKFDSRRGTSALFDHFHYLSSENSGWDHTLVAWTGEIFKQVSSTIPPLPPPHAKKELETLLNASQSDPYHGKKQHSSVPQTSKEITLTKELCKSLDLKLSSHASGKIVPVWLTNHAFDESDTITLKDQRRWTRYSENVLSSLLHYKQAEPSDGRQGKKSYADYCKLNQLFADRILKIYQPGDIILIHDHHLMRLPALLRQKVSNMYIGFFLQTPFPSSELFRCLPHRRDILDGMLGSNMIGFQSYSYSRHFASCCTRILGFPSTSIKVDAYGAFVAMDTIPIGINANSILGIAFDNRTNNDEKVAAIKKLYAGKKIIIGSDRIDSLGGVAQKLQAFEMFLKMFPEWRDEVVLIQITSSSNKNSENEINDQKYANKIDHLVNGINRQFGSHNHTPVHHFPQYLAKKEYFALLRAADVGLITSLRDGVNTTSLEFILCQRDNHGPLIISEFSGISKSLSSALQVNPWDFHSVALTIKKALEMHPLEKASVHNELISFVTSHDIQHWSNKFLHRLLRNISSYNQSFGTPVLDRSLLLHQYRQAKKRLFMFDYDGTLTPIVMDPQAAIPSDRVIRTLKTLSSDPNNVVWVISGRDQAFLDEWMGHIPTLGLSAEHGSFLRYPGKDEWVNVAAGMNMDWRDEVKQIFTKYTERTQGSFIEMKKIAVTWHYRRSDPDYGIFQANECQKELKKQVEGKWDVETMEGKANLEVRPKFVNKGEIAKKLIQVYGQDLKKPLGLVLCLGDDSTDEDMFRSINASNLSKKTVFTVTVGAPSKQTDATWHVLEPSDVIQILKILNGNTSSSTNFVGPSSSTAEGSVSDMG